ncbi:hypothetical protein IF650_02765 [Cellulosimicrobium terreum]|nr:hypothetical protein [Cellulosimicrobium terreum]
MARTPRTGLGSVRSVGTFGTLAAVLLLAAACSGGDDEGPEPVTVGAEEYEPVITTTVPVPGSPDDEVTVGVVSLDASGSTAELKVVLTPHFASAEPEDTISIYDMFGYDVLPTILDVDALTSYDVVSSGGESLRTDVNRAKARNDEPILFQAWFPRPKGDPAAVDLTLHASWPVFEDMPVTYESED